MVQFELECDQCLRCTELVLALWVDGENGKKGSLIEVEPECRRVNDTIVFKIHKCNGEPSE